MAMAEASQARAKPLSGLRVRVKRKRKNGPSHAARGISHRPFAAKSEQRVPSASQRYPRRGEGSTWGRRTCVFIESFFLFSPTMAKLARGELALVSCCSLHCASRKAALPFLGFFLGDSLADSSCLPVCLLAWPCAK